MPFNASICSPRRACVNIKIVLREENLVRPKPYQPYRFLRPWYREYADRLGDHFMRWTASQSIPCTGGADNA